MRKKLTISIVAILLILAIFGLGKQIQNALESGKRLDLATDELIKLQRENQSLLAMLEEVQKISFIEEQARNKLNMAFFNESIYLIPEEKIKMLLPKEEKRQELKLPNWQGWLKLIFH